MRRIINLAMTAILATVFFAAISHSDTTRVSARPAAVPVSAVSKTAKRVIALNYAKKQNGDSYVYGGNGPNGWDCSGLTTKAYKVAGISLPRTSGAQRSSSKTVHVSRYKAKPGDLVFWGSGHVELLVKIYKKSGKWYTQTFGAGNSRTDVRYRTVSGVPHIEHVKGAG